MINLMTTYFRLTFLNKVNIFTSILLPVLLITILGMSLSGLFTSKAPDQVETKIEMNTFDKPKIIESWSQSEAVEGTLMLVDSDEFMNLSQLDQKLIIEFKAYDLIKQSIGWTYYKNLVSIYGLLDADQDKPEQLLKYEHISGISNSISSTVGSYDTINSISFYSVTMIILTLAYTMGVSGNYVNQNLKSAIGSRICLSGISNWKIINTGLVTLVGVSMLQVLMVILVLKLGFKDHVYNLQSIFMLFLAAMFFTLLGMNLAIRINDQRKFTIVINCLVPFFVMISGGYYKIDFGLLKYLAPNYWFSKGIFDVYLNDQLNVNVVVLSLVMIVALYILAVVSINKIEGVKYDSVD